jgi:hypothetical protein
VCDVCTGGAVARFEGETILCNFCTDGIEAQLAEISERLNIYAERLEKLDAMDAADFLNREAQAWRDDIEDEFIRLCSEHDALEKKMHELAAA